jgi:tellurite resistance protein TerC
VFTESFWLWCGFALLVGGMLAIDLGVLQRGGRTMSQRAAGVWTLVWISVALGFNALIFARSGTEAGLAFFTAYLIEKSLSVDNIFVFVMLFSIFAVPVHLQRRVLTWGVLGALVMRGVFIGAGVALLHQFSWLIYVMGAFLVVTGVRLLRGGESGIDPQRNPLVRLFRRIMPVTDEFEGDRFFVRRDGRRWATPLLLVLLAVESTDVVFAIDSIPAVLSITQDPFLVYTSNVFAILGLRALYFLLAGAVAQFYYLKPALALILSFVGVKMLVGGAYKIPAGVSLGAIAGLLAVAIVASLVRSRRLQAASAGRGADVAGDLGSVVDAGP